MNKFQKLGFMMKVDDVLSVFSTHGVAAITGGLLTGVLANPDMLEYIGTDKDAPGVSITGWLYGNPTQLLLQAEGAAFIIVFNAIATYIILKIISFIVPLRMDEATLKVGDDAVHGETAYAIGTEGPPFFLLPATEADIPQLRDVGRGICSARNAKLPAKLRDKSIRARATFCCRQQSHKRHLLWPKHRIPVRHGAF